MLNIQATINLHKRPSKYQHKQNVKPLNSKDKSQYFIRISNIIDSKIAMHCSSRSVTSQITGNDPTTLTLCNVILMISANVLTITSRRTLYTLLEHYINIS